MISATTFVIIGITLLVYYYFSRDRNRNRPPGPTGLPFVGNMFQMGKSPFKQLNKWSKEYGSICWVKIGHMSVYLVSDHKMVKEIFSNEAAFTGRADLGDVNDLYSNGIRHGVLNSDGEQWEQLRRFTLRQLRDFGFGKSTMENLIMEEMKEVLDWMKLNEGQSIGNIKDKFSIAVVNSLWTIMTGKRFDHDDPLLLSLTYKSTKGVEEIAEKGGLIFFAPWLKHIIPEWSGYNARKGLMNQFREIFTETVEEHKKTYSDDSQRDFIDTFLKEIKECKHETSAFHGDLGERQLIATIADLFQAGSESTSGTMSWIMLYLTNFPEVQKKLQEEIQNVVGNSRHSSLTDRPNMPYCEALLAEILRHTTAAPFGVPHKVLADREYRGYVVPKDTVFMPNVYYIHHDPKIWGDPEHFRPERFLSPDGKTFKKPEALIPFSIGRRQCRGETLARDQLFLLITNIFQKFNVVLDPSVLNPGIEPRIGFMLNPQPYKIIMTERTA